MSGWLPWTGGPCPDMGGKKIHVRLRCMDRATAAMRQAVEPKSFTRWGHDGGPGDIVEIMEAQA